MGGLRTTFQVCWARSNRLRGERSAQLGQRGKPGTWGANLALKLFWGFRTFSYRGMWTRCCRGGPCISSSGARSGRMSSQVGRMLFQGGFHFPSLFEKSVWRSPVDATWQPGTSAPHRLPGPWTTSHLQPAHYLQGAANQGKDFNSHRPSNASSAKIA